MCKITWFHRHLMILFELGQQYSRPDIVSVCTCVVRACISVLYVCASVFECTVHNKIIHYWSLETIDCDSICAHYIYFYIFWFHFISGTQEGAERIFKEVTEGSPNLFLNKLPTLLSKLDKQSDLVSWYLWYCCDML